MVAIKSVINSKFIDKLAALGRGEARDGAAASRALRGDAAESRVSSSLRYGAQFYSRALSGINFAGSFLNFARSDLEQLASITSKAIEVVENAADVRSTRNDRINADRALQEMGRDVKDILSGAVVGDRKYLSEVGIEDIFVTIGLDPSQNREVRGLFNSFETLGKDRELASLDMKGEDSQPQKGAGKPKSTHNTQPLFDGSRSITRPADAQAILDDLNALSKQIRNNIGVIDELNGVLAENAFLVRSTALAFLEVGDSISTEDDADDVAKSLQRMILKNSRQALTQAQNLEPIVVATLAYESSGIVSDG